MLNHFTKGKRERYGGDEYQSQQEPAVAILLMTFIVPALLGFISFFAVLLGAKAMLLLLRTSTGRHSDRERTPTSG